MSHLLHNSAREEKLESEKAEALPGDVCSNTINEKHPMNAIAANATKYRAYRQKLVVSVVTRYFCSRLLSSPQFLAAPSVRLDVHTPSLWSPVSDLGCVKAVIARPECFHFGYFQRFIFLCIRRW